MKNFLFVTALALSTQAHALVQTLEGQGLDGEACQVTIDRDGNTLRKVDLSGAAEVFQILNDNGSDGYGPSREIQARGGDTVLSAAINSMDLFQHSKNMFSDGEVFSLNSSDIPGASEELGGINMKMSLELKYKNNELISVSASTKVKAMVLVPVASSKFICKK